MEGWKAALGQEDSHTMAIAEDLGVGEVGKGGCEGGVRCCTGTSPCKEQGRKCHPLLRCSCLFGLETVLFRPGVEGDSGEERSEENATKGTVLLRPSQSVRLRLMRLEMSEDQTGDPVGTPICPRCGQ